MKTLKEIKGKCHIDKGSKCWHWRGCKDNGTPKMWFQGRRQSVRRVVLELKGTPLAPDRYPTMTCRNDDCVQFECMRVVTKSEYMLLGRAASPRPADWTARVTIGRRKAGNVKLSIEKVREIRARKAAGEKNIRIAPDYGINHSMVSKIVLGQAWREADPWSSLKDPRVFKDYGATATINGQTIEIKHVPYQTEPKTVNAD